MDNLLENSENANYINSLKELRPTCAWLWSEKDEISSWVSKHADIESFETVMKNQIGCYLFARWSREVVDEKRKQLHVLCTFLEITAKLRTCDGFKRRNELVKMVMEKFFDTSQSWEPNKEFTENGSLGIVWDQEPDSSAPGLIDPSNSNPMNFDMTSSVFSETKQSVSSAQDNKSIPDDIFGRIESIVMNHIKLQVSSTIDI